MKDLTLALDIGTTSVGWAILDKNYNIPMFKGKNLWGVRLFGSAQTAEERRVQRGTRRRYLRRRRRLELLQLLFQDEINKIDSSFFDVEVNDKEWLKNRPVVKNGGSFSNFENKSVAEVLDRIGEDKRKYKNIYFLQSDILGKDEKIDLRLLYLAVYSNVKYRGHFLNNFDFQQFDVDNNLSENLCEFLELEEQPDYLCDIINILKQPGGIKFKKDELSKIIGKDNKILLNRLFLLAGASIDINVTFDHDDYKGRKFSVSYSNEEPFKDYEINDLDMDILVKGHNIYLNLLIGKILGNETNICNAQKNAWYEFNNDLKSFKSIIKEHSPINYKSIFKKHGLFDNYLYGKDYSSDKSSKLTKDAAYAELTKILKAIKSEDSEVKRLQDKLENGELFLKQRSKVNASTPHQLKAKDVYDMLKNQQKYYNFIDDEFIDKVVKLITYRIPYYVGPLIKQEDDSEFGWLIRNSDLKITPWNIDDIIDKDQTAEEFINRMVGRCSYLYNVGDKIDNKVMPLESLTYQLFKVYNELNGIRIIDIKGAKPRLLNKEEKYKLIEDGFKKNNTLSLKKAKNILGYNNEIELKGTQDKEKFASTLSTYIFFKKFVDNPLDHSDEIDQVVRILTVFNNEEIIKRQLNQVSIAKNNYDKIRNLKVSGWGKICEFLLKEIKSNGKNIIDYLVEGSDKEVINLQKLITSEDYTFKEQIEKLNNDEVKRVKYEDIENLAGSPSLKRGIWQTILVVDELIKTHKLDIKNIAIEFAGGDSEKKRSKKFTDTVKEICSNSKEHKEISNNHDDLDFSKLNERLYMLQQGKCLYSGEELHLNEVRSGVYDIDHIRARSFTKDDSIDNLALVKEKYNQSKGDDKTPLQVIPSNIRQGMIVWWKSLHKCGAISENKLKRLMKESYSEIELNRFLQRTIVETRQIGKHVKELLENSYPDIDIYNVSSHFTDSFRSKVEIPKIRGLSVKHHCEDAYMLATVTKYTLNKYGGDFFELGKNNTKLWYVSKDSKITSKDRSNIVLNSIIKDEGVFGKNPIEYIRSEMQKDFLRTVRVSYAGSNSFWNESNYSPFGGKNSKYDFISEGRNTIKNDYKAAYLLLIEYDLKKSKKYTRKREIIKVDQIIDKNKEFNISANKYHEIAKALTKNNKKPVNNISVIKKIEIGQLIDDGNRYTIKNESLKNNFNEFNIPIEIKGAFEKFTNDKKFNDLDEKSAKMHFDKIIKFTEDNFIDILGNNTKLIYEKCKEKYIDKNTKDFYKNLEKKFEENYSNNVLVNYLKIDFILDDAQIKTLKYDGQTLDEMKDELCSVYSCGNNEHYDITFKMINEAIELKIEKLRMEGYRKCVNEIIKAISIGAGRSDDLRLVPLKSKIKLDEFKLVHQSPTGIIEYVTKPLSEISKDKKLDKR